MNNELFFKRTVDGNLPTVREQVEKALKEVGFGVLTEIDMQAKLEEKLGVKMPPYTVLGVCSPKFANEAIQVEENIGIFLPCKVLLKQSGDGKIDVLVLNPAAPMQMMKNEKLNAIASEVTALLKKVTENI